VLVAISGDGKLVATGADQAATLYDAATGNKLRSVPEKSNISAVYLSGDGKRLVTGAWDSKATVWDTATGNKLQTVDGLKTIVYSVNLSGDGKHLAAGFQGKTAILWDAATGNKLQTFTGHTALIWGLSVSHAGKFLWTASQDGTTRLWSTATGKELCTLFSLDAGKEWLVLTPDGYFDGSPDACQRMTWRQAGSPQVIDDEATRKRYYRPGLLGLLVKGEKLS
jgi:WD40 repeat protein